MISGTICISVLQGQIPHLKLSPPRRIRVLLHLHLADRLTGEAYFLRGMTYYYLAGTFGGVPLELSDQTDGLTPRSSQDSVFMQIVSDMQQAEQLLLSKTTLPAS